MDNTKWSFPPPQPKSPETKPCLSHLSLKNGKRENGKNFKVNYYVPMDCLTMKRHPNKPNSAFYKLESFWLYIIKPVSSNFVIANTLSATYHFDSMTKPQCKEQFQKSTHSPISFPSLHHFPSKVKTREWAEWVRQLKRYKLPVAKSVSPRDVMYSTVTI